MVRYVALLRGINVGGNNLIKMLDLKACFEAHGFTQVSTYIQSGNVVFASQETDLATLSRQIETLLSKTFNYASRVVVRSESQMKKIIAGAPKGFGAEPTKYRYYVLFLKEPLTATQVMKEIPLKEGVDQAWAGPEGVVFHERVEKKATQSYLNRLVAMPMYKDMTIRNWNTTTKLLARLNPEEG